jgi:hypothetical protein
MDNWYSTVVARSRVALRETVSGLDFEPPSQYGVGFGVGSAEDGKEEQGKARRNRLGQAAGLQRFTVETLNSERVRTGPG